MNEEILIMGSSRALHHYNPTIIEDSLQMTCYNCGRGGMGIIFSYGIYQLFKNRYTPKLIIYDVYDNFDLINEGNNEKYLDWLRYFYDRPEIVPIFSDIDKSEKYKMAAQMRRYNYKFIQIISDYISPQQYIKGYLPLQGILKYEPSEESNNINGTIQYDNMKIMFIKKFIQECKERGTRLVFMLSPKYKGEKNKVSYEELIHLAESENIPFISHYNEDKISFNKKYFEDSYHMNKSGAEIYTKNIINEIRQYIDKPQKAH